MNLVNSYQDLISDSFKLVRKKILFKFIDQYCNPLLILIPQGISFLFAVFNDTWVNEVVDYKSSGVDN